ncbi:hypothetical protein [Flavobacterium cerinum]|uniref:DUF1801 domain-containing protein n=1 Tax=Flavobacterium cerinum TaxID=2502784 RepID=A0ABY5J0M1_9FLAO|nr:hypothetical protein [Flavobacterium cerinum]UUC47282.1 hypothetical protein NOX80_08795 [Flavobacterium cerinum]
MKQTQSDKAILHIQEVYASDMTQLKSFFNVLQDQSQEMPVNETFGIPFLQIKEEEKLIGFASLILDENDKADYVLYPKNLTNDKDDQQWKEKVDNVFREKQLTFFKDKDAFQKGIMRLLNWLNHSYN